MRRTARLSLCALALCQLLPGRRPLGAAHAAAAADAATTVFTHGEEGFPCFRVPSTLALPFDVMLSFAAARAYMGDSCYPSSAGKDPKRYSAHVVKRSSDRGSSWGALTEIGRTPEGPYGPRGEGRHYGYLTASPEGCNFFSQKHQSVLTIFQLDNVSHASTGLKLWQAETDVSGLAWTAPHPMVIPALRAANVTGKTHIAPGNGIELQHGPHAGRLLHVLILVAACTLDVVVYSDNGGKSWQLSETALPHNGEAQLAEVRTANGSSAIIFDGRSDYAGAAGPFPRGEATVLSFKGSDHCLSLCFSAFPCGSTALTADR
eukprot:SAG22_NODE_1298_length_4811_cov_3.430178_1_plen_318_part_10